MSDPKPPVLRPVPRGPGGRPPTPDRLTPVSAWVPASYHDHLAKVARERDVTVSCVVRDLLILRLK